MILRLLKIKVLPFRQDPSHSNTEPGPLLALITTLTDDNTYTSVNPRQPRSRANVSCMNYFSQQPEPDIQDGDKQFLYLSVSNLFMMFIPSLLKQIASFYYQDLSHTCVPLGVNTAHVNSNASLNWLPTRKPTSKRFYRVRYVQRYSIANKS